MAIFVIFVLCALKNQGEMAAAHLCLNRKLVYGQIIRKIGFQAFNFAADDGLSLLPTLHRDPFDRLIIAQAIRPGFHLVTPQTVTNAQQIAAHMPGFWHQLRVAI